MLPLSATEIIDFTSKLPSGLFHNLTDDAGRIEYLELKAYASHMCLRMCLSIHLDVCPVTLSLSNYSVSPLSKFLFGHYTHRYSTALALV